MGNWLPLVRFSPACIGTVLLDGYRSLFFLLLQVPSSEQCLRRLLCRRRQKKKESKRNPPIAVLTSEPLHSSFFPQQGHFHTSSWQNIKHNKKVPLLLRGETNYSFTTLGSEQQSFLGAFFGAFIVLLSKVSQTVVIRQIKEGKLLPGKKFCFVPTSSSDQL